MVKGLRGFQKGVPSWNKGTKGYNVGRKTSEETKYKIKMSNLGKKRSEETKRKIKLANIGKILSEETKQKMSNSHMGKSNKWGHHSEETKKLMSINNSRYWFGKKNPNFGKKYPKELYPNLGWRTTRKNQIFPFRDSSIEIKIQNFLKELHIEFFTHQYMKIPHSYQCDIFIPSIKTIIECDGCFWHGCKFCKQDKITESDIRRKNIDALRTQELVDKGYKVVRLWEHEIKKMELNDFKDKL